jgi:REP element-mobilizing transposase RayT
MSRPLRIEFPGALYHITSRGNARRKLFLDEKDYTDFLQVLCLVVQRFHWNLHAYCLMSNHYHLLLETPEGNLSRGMRQLNGVYTQHFNRRHNRVGHLFQGRYKAILVDRESYLLALCRYVVLNPVRANLVKNPKEWPWSSYRGTAGYGKPLSCLRTDWVLEQLANERAKAIIRYREFVREGIKEGAPWKEVKGQLLLGNEDFIGKMKEWIRGKEKLKEIPRFQRYMGRPSLEEILKEKDRGKKSEERKIYEAYSRYGYTLKEIADYLGVHYSTVSRMVKKTEELR